MQQQFFRALKRAFSEVFPSPEVPTIDTEQNTTRSVLLESWPVQLLRYFFRTLFQDLCNEIYLQIFEYLHGVDLLYSFTDLDPRLDALVGPYASALDFRLISRSYFECLSQRILPILSDHVRVLRLSNVGTFNQIGEVLNKLNWSRIEQLESLTMDTLEIEDLFRYLNSVHPLLKRLWRLTMTIAESSVSIEELRIARILTREGDSSPMLSHVSITGVTFDLATSARHKCNRNLCELTITLRTVNDLLILYKLAPRLEILTCTVLTNTDLVKTEIVATLDCLSTLALTLNEPISFANLREILTPHRQLKYLRIRATLSEPVKGAKRAVHVICISLLGCRGSSWTDFWIGFRETFPDLSISEETSILLLSLPNQPHPAERFVSLVFPIGFLESTFDSSGGTCYLRTEKTLCLHGTLRIRSIRSSRRLFIMFRQCKLKRLHQYATHIVDDDYCLWGTHLCISD